MIDWFLLLTVTRVLKLVLTECGALCYTRTNKKTAQDAGGVFVPVPFSQRRRLKLREVKCWNLKLRVEVRS